jgi:hypothetical protein
MKPLYAFLLALLGIAFVGVGIRGRKPKIRRIVSFSIGLLIILGALQAGCGGGNPTSVPPPRQGTPPGTYSITVMGTSPGLQHSITVSLTVR